MAADPLPHGLPDTLAGWLTHLEAAHPSEIDMGLARTQAVRARLGLHFEVPLIVVAGTNGKGSTCALLESILLAAGYRVGLYAKPHLVHFTERCRIGGESVNEAVLVPHFEAVEAARAACGVSLTYFEFTTLAIARTLALAPLDVVILEVGLGGRLDAVNVFDADVSIVTNVALDHTDYLGPDRESIGFEKAGIARAGRVLVVAEPEPPDSLMRHADAVGAPVWLAGRDFHHSGDRQQWSWSGPGRRWHALAYPALRGANQLLNASGALAALQALASRLPLTAQAVRLGLARVSLPGRFQQLPGQPALVLDVGHNVQAVSVLARNLDQMGFFPRTWAVLGMMADKDISGCLRAMLPVVDAWVVCDLPTPRAARSSDLAGRVARAWQQDQDVQRAAGRVDAQRPEPLVLQAADPAAALALALERADAADRIVVFGSFYTVGGVLAAGLPRLAAAHAPAASGLATPGSA
ncbi:bifunctional tetrahydrofolate synthase/dihydrofolate synthase [Amphibiibacter pelophylacis]|uniref:Bifunctional tetrahydrofolate synthase/dihydrofolate synthase n=1 Tax=Amphibiibacter pelophylacis TaxID=1799477 RepID=A0ACC6P3B6_9BURK